MDAWLLDCLMVIQQGRKEKVATLLQIAIASSKNVVGTKGISHWRRVQARLSLPDLAGDFSSPLGARHQPGLRLRFSKLSRRLRSESGNPQLSNFR
jgi:hypothetical protein